MVVLGNGSGISEGKTGESSARGTKNEADKPRNDVNESCVLERIPVERSSTYILSHSKRLWNIGIKLLEDSKVGRRYTNQMQKIPHTGEKGITGRNRDDTED